MPRTLTSALQAQVSSTATKMAFLVELNLSTVIRLTNWYSNVTYQTNVYEAGGSFLDINAITETGKLQVDEVNMNFSNITADVRSLVQDGSFTDKKVEVYLAYFDASDVIVGAINYFTGHIRHVSISESLEGSDISLTVASHWANWNLTKGRHFSDESQQLFSPGDKGMEFATTVKTDIRWGS